MTFDDAVQTTVGEVLPEIRDTVTGMTGWSLKDESAADSSSYVSGDFFVITTPDDEDIKIGIRQENVSAEFTEFNFQWGKNYNTTDDNWGENDSDLFPHGNTFLRIYENRDTNPNHYDPTNPATYWMQYDPDDGFVVCVERTLGDGYDQSCVFGYADVKMMWDYTVASQYESRYVCVHKGDEGLSAMNCLASGTDDVTLPANGRANGDGNFSNFPLTQKNILASPQFNSTLIGTHTLWIRDIDNSLNHGDTIQDSSGTDIYKVVNPTGDFENVGLRLG